jgi:hypothetical protein
VKNRKKQKAQKKMTPKKALKTAVFDPALVWACRPNPLFFTKTDQKNKSQKTSKKKHPKNIN